MSSRHGARCNPWAPGQSPGALSVLDLERLLQCIVWLVPNPFFVITGRS
ncbi:MULTISPECIES: hypothetical protein [Streptomyces]|uniref:Transposase n=1 Tax=Streptomyces bugieae TaxID=3098223 RepID=A0ABU7NP79_9ACTN|nr:hypothetical protein [Streptomyces nigrescens]MEE4420665.1 hypothetical protein [Streptomyces sp. DSM 41528]